MENQNYFITAILGERKVISPYPYDGMQSAIDGLRFFQQKIDISNIENKEVNFGFLKVAEKDEDAVQQRFQSVDGYLADAKQKMQAKYNIKPVADETDLKQMKQNMDKVFCTDKDVKTVARYAQLQGEALFYAVNRTENIHSYENLNDWLNERQQNKHANKERVAATAIHKVKRMGRGV
jgi:hypothetical protein